MQEDGRCRRGRDSWAMSVVWLSEGVRAEQGLEIDREAARVVVRARNDGVGGLKQKQKREKQVRNGDDERWCFIGRVERRDSWIGWVGTSSRGQQVQAKDKVNDGDMDGHGCGGWCSLQWIKPSAVGTVSTQARQGTCDTAVI